MSRIRFVFHPIMANPKSRLIFFWFLVVSIIVGAGLWMRVDSILQGAGVDWQDVRVQKTLLSQILLSAHFRLFIIISTALFSGAFTAHFVVGPINRMVEWINDWHEGRPLHEFKVRRGDKFENIATLLNELYHQSKAKQ